MKTLFVLLVGIAIGAAGMYYYLGQPRTPGPTAVESDPSLSARDATDRAIARTRAVASDMSDALSEKMKEWKLTPADIRADLSRGGEIARQKTAVARERVADVRIIAMIKAKFVLDRDLSVTSIDVSSNDGKVVLTGTVASEALIGKAVAHALDTDGVQNVNAKLTVKN